MHTLVLLDIKVREQSDENMARGRKIYEPPRYMSPATAISQILHTENQRSNPPPEDAADETDELTTTAVPTLPQSCLNPETTLAISLSRVGSADKQRIVCGTLAELSKLSEDDFGEPLFSLVIVGKRLHELEVEYAEEWAVNKEEWRRVAKDVYGARLDG